MADPVSLDAAVAAIKKYDLRDGHELPAIALWMHREPLGVDDYTNLLLQLREQDILVPDSPLGSELPYHLNAAGDAVGILQAVVREPLAEYLGRMLRAEPRMGGMGYTDNRLRYPIS